MNPANISKSPFPSNNYLGFTLRGKTPGNIITSCDRIYGNWSRKLCDVSIDRCLWDLLLLCSDPIDDSGGNDQEKATRVCFLVAI